MLLGQFGSRHRVFLDSMTGVISPGPSHVTLRSRDFVDPSQPNDDQQLVTHLNHHVIQQPPQQQQQQQQPNNTTNHNNNNHHEPAGVGGEENG